MKLFALQNIFSDLDSLKDCVASNKFQKTLEIVEGAIPFFIAGLKDKIKKNLLIVCPDEEITRKIHAEFKTIFESEFNTLLFQDKQLLPYENIITDLSINTDTVSSLDYFIKMNERSDPFITFSSISRLLALTVPRQIFQENILQITQGDHLKLTDLRIQLLNLGYELKSFVDIPGSFSVRGGILDVFSFDNENPCRFEFLGDKIENIRIFDSVNQRSIEKIFSVNIIPAHETPGIFCESKEFKNKIDKLDFTNCHSIVKKKFDNWFSLLKEQNYETLSSFIDYFNSGIVFEYISSDTIVVMIQPDQIQKEMKELWAITSERNNMLVESGELPKYFPIPFVSPDIFNKALNKFSAISVNDWGDSNTNKQVEFGNIPHFNRDINGFIKYLKNEIPLSDIVIIATKYGKNLSREFYENELEHSLREHLDTIPTNSRILIIPTRIVNGWKIKLQNKYVHIFSDQEIWGIKKLSLQTKKTKSISTNILSELEPGAYVVHVDHGIGRFMGIKTFITELKKEYLDIQYANDERIYVPTDQVDRISVYLSPTGIVPKLTRLGPQWSLVKSQVKESTLEVARQMLELYVSRKNLTGISYSEDTIWQTQLEESFPYEETIDQIKAIDDVKQDMMSNNPMDRLICGDVGYGKTEVAIRAVFKAVQDGYQVCILVPTTILAHQHYLTFSERFAPFPIKLTLLSRFLKAFEQKKLLEELQEGTVDIVIGTHRLLQSDVKFKNLGLVIIDEEHRFGVEQKERFAYLRKEIDVLSLSATPIPRTLYMAMSGVRDMSIMETAPEGRIPIEVFVSETNPNLINEVISRELERKGQVFYLHNRVFDIEKIKRELQVNFPSASIEVVHGKTSELDLESVMMNFINGDIDILICTTIIEAGIDIPNANTLIVERADLLGLSQLYQLKGRVGRSAKRGYCYFLIPDNKKITRFARYRLRAILESSELGSGFRLAIRDLEIRGAGNLLGKDQSGNLNRVGYELFRQMLGESIVELNKPSKIQKDTVVKIKEPSIDLPLDYFIPNEYISELPVKLDIYRRFAQLQTITTINDFARELKDRFGRVPKPLSNMLFCLKIKHLAKTIGVASIRHDMQDCIITFEFPLQGAGPAIQKAIGSGVKVGNFQIRVSLIHKDKWQDTLLTVFKVLKKFQKTFL